MVTRGDGLRLTSPPRTAFDLASRLQPLALESVIEQGLDLGMLTIPILWDVARRLTARGRAGSARFVEVLASRPLWQAPADSHDEVVLARALVQAGLPPPVRQHCVDLGRFQIHLDLAWPDRRLGVEVDHVAWHGGRVASQRDKERDRLAAARQWRIVRVTDDDVRHRLDEVVDDIVEAYRA